ncbi:XisH family protein [Nostoc sp. FACHB-888]|uniref:XisH family protein n=1 Tax=Nostoc sp. FACHB-888 TaxID=2692842 RepID=UPI001684D663|nr:XisH family protein [Nostoc sp. FACHB-888]MBD2243634.1 XisH family protein [Nostoc sp. FACHB-888]
MHLNRTVLAHDPLSISVGGVNASIDLAAEKLIAAEREGEKIAVEVKSFLEKSSAISEFHTALGQFINYRGALRRRQPERVLYLTVPLTTYKTFFQLDFPQAMIEENQVKMIIYDVEQEVIFKWIN